MRLAEMLIAGCLVLFCVSVARADWRHDSIGNVLQTHYYYEGEELKGILVGSEEGVIALLNPDDGKIMWRNYPLAGRKFHRLIAQDRCRFL
jgi:hypothetical protein